MLVFCCRAFSQGEAPDLPQRPTLGHPLYHYVVQGPHALALFDYTASESDELSFSVSRLICSRVIMSVLYDSAVLFPSILRHYCLGRIVRENV